MRPLKWKCTNECRLLTSGEMDAVLGTKLLFQKNMELALTTCYSTANQSPQKITYTGSFKRAIAGCCWQSCYSTAHKMNVPGPLVITQSTVSLVKHMYVSTYQLMGAKGCGGYTHAMLPRISVGYMAQYNLAYENSSSNNNC